MKKQLATIMSVAVYCRLSRDDENAGESESIQNQRAMLTDYANAQGFSIYSEYCDDGYSGLDFERPAFKRMMADIEYGHVNSVLVKDCSRLGFVFCSICPIWVQKRTENKGRLIIDEPAAEMVKRMLYLGSIGYGSRKMRNIFAGIAFCADCGYVMGYKAKTDNSLISLACSNYGRNGKTACTNHLINYDALYELKLEQIRNYARLALEEQEQLMELLIHKTANHDSCQLYIMKEELSIAEKRYKELDTLFMWLYEDYMAGKIKANRYGKMSVVYEQEQEYLEKQIDELKSEIASFKDTDEDRAKWLDLIKKYANIEALDKCIINELVERIEVGQGRYGYIK